VSFGRAKAKAREWFERAAEPATDDYTVDDAVCDYLDCFASKRKGVVFILSAFILFEAGAK
jgi:hypothetical protein